MKVTYDSEADAVHITLRDVQPDHATELSPGVYGHYDSKGNVVALEVLDATRRLEEPTSVTLELLRQEMTV